jgi:hypothetical protein
LQAEHHNNIDSEFVSVEGLGGQLFKMAVTGALTAGVGAALAPAMVGLSAGAQGAINGGLNSAIGGVVSGNGLDIKDIGVGALTGGVGGSLSNADGMLGGFIDTGSNLADDAIKGAITGGIGGAIDGDVLGGALTGGVSGAGMNLLEQGVGWAGDKIGGLTDDLTGPGEFDFASGPNWDLDDQLTNDMNLDMLQEIIPGGEYREIPDSVQDALDQQAMDDYYSPPEQIQVGNQDIIDQMNENDLNAILDYEASDEFVGPSASGAADYDHTTPAGQILDNMSQEDVISESYLFDQYGREMDGTYTIGEINGKTSIIETATGNYVTSEATAGNPFEIGDPRRSFYEQLSEFDKHLYMAGTLPSPGLSASPVDFIEDVPEELTPEQVEQTEQEQPKEQQDASESDPVNNTDTSLDSGEKGGGTDGTPSNPTDTAVGTILADLEREKLEAIRNNNTDLADAIQKEITKIATEVLAGGDPTGSTNPSGNPSATPGGQNTNENGNGGLDNGTGTGAGTDTGSGVQTGTGTGTGETGNKGGNGDGAGDPGIGAGFGGMLAGLGAGGGGGNGDGEGLIWTPLNELTKLTPWQKRRHHIQRGLLQSVLDTTRRA